MNKKNDFYLLINLNNYKINILIKDKTKILVKK